MTVKIRASYRKNFKNKHDIQPPEIERPNLNNPNFYCKVCKLTYTSLSNYAKRCRHIHPKNLDFVNLINNNGLPDISNPISYCKTYKKTYSASVKYHGHSRYVHRLLDVMKMITRYYCLLWYFISFNMYYTFFNFDYFEHEPRLYKKKKMFKLNK
jgi:hypothetical protein